MLTLVYSRIGVLTGDAANVRLLVREDLSRSSSVAMPLLIVGQDT